jgi:hypothetical protein
VAFIIIVYALNTLAWQASTPSADSGRGLPGISVWEPGSGDRVHGPIWVSEVRVATYVHDAGRSGHGVRA